jgi:energy-coupling factor transport system ATP-binding protein
VSLLSLENVGFTYRRATERALRGLNLEVAAGEWVGVLGGAGAGKSTLAGLVCGLLPRFASGVLEGRLLLDGRPPGDWDRAARAARIGLVMEDFEAQLFLGRVDLEVAFGPENLGVSRPEMEQRIREALAVVGLEGLEARPPDTLSGGQRQRLVLASVLALRPALLFLDEPWSDLDPGGWPQLWSTLRRNFPSGILTASDPSHLEGVDRLLLLREGQVLAQGDPASILADDELLDRAGVPLLPLAALFRRMGRDERPASVEEAIGLFPATPRDRVAPAEPPSLGPPVLEAKGLSCVYPDGTAALTGVDLTVRGGEMVAILGRNGSGKTTLARHLAGLVHPTAGTVRVRGREIGARAAPRLGTEVGYIFQNPDHQIFAETVLDEVSFGPRNLGCTPGQVAERATEALAAVGLDGLESEDPFALPRGDRQRLAVASALAARPRILLFDEPTTGLDASSIAAMMDLLHGLAGSGHTILFITHSMELAAHHARRIVLLDAGRILRDGSARQVLHDSPALDRAGLHAPPLVELAARLGLQACHVEELAACLA